MGKGDTEKKVRMKINIQNEIKGHKIPKKKRNKGLFSTINYLYLIRPLFI